MPWPRPTGDLQGYCRPFSVIPAMNPTARLAREIGRSVRARQLALSANSGRSRIRRRMSVSDWEGRFTDGKRSAAGDATPPFKRRLNEGQRRKEPWEEPPADSS